jgi:tungstate transport system substrate-binding protein
MSISLLRISTVVATAGLLLAACAASQTVATPHPTADTSVPVVGVLRLATTTSTQDSGLLDAILPVFEKKSGVKVEVIAVGTGQALKLGEDGNADVVLVHARSQEDAFMKAEHGVRREDVMYNDFVVIGPANDPAGVRVAKSAADSFLAIHQKKNTFISRGDNSGTHTKELAIWKQAGINPAGDWYLAAGQGMGAVLNMSDELNAYTLTDRATYLARRKQNLSLMILLEGDRLLFNPYGVIAVNPAKNLGINGARANQFIDWLISLEAQTLISEFGKAEFGQSLFMPDSTLWKAQ